MQTQKMHITITCSYSTRDMFDVVMTIISMWLTILCCCQIVYVSKK